MGHTRRGLIAATAAAALSSRWVAPACAQADAHARLSVGAQREDLAIARHVLEESHVGLEWYLDRARLTARYEALVQGSGAPASRAAFQLRLTRLIASLGHGHTTLEARPPGAGYWLRRIPVDGAAFPLGLRVINGRLFVVHDLSVDGDIGDGTEVLTIDGVAASDLMGEMEGLLSADGLSPSFRRYQLGQGWRFHDLLRLLGRGRDRHELGLLRLDGRSVQTSLVAATTQELMRRFDERRGRGLDVFGPAVAYDRRSADGVLTVRSFYEGLLPPGSAGFAAEFARAFDQMGEDRPRRLMLDLRSNEGGNNDYVPLLYSYLAHRPFRMAEPTIVRSATISGLGYMDAPSEELRAFAADPRLFISADPIYGWTLKPEYAPTIDHDPAPNAYLGPLGVLTDGGSFSATGAILDLIYRYHRREGRQVDFYGEAPGVDTSLGWSSGGQSLVVTLPNSQLKLAIPLLGARNHFSTSPFPIALPDRVLTPAPADLNSNVDAVLLRTLA